MLFTIKNHLLECQISTYSAEIISVKRISDGKDYMWDGHDFWQRHAPLLFPFCGYISQPYFYRGKKYDESVKHGFLNKTEFCGTQITQSEVVFTVKDSPETLAMYPFSFEFTARYYLDGDTLCSEYKIKNCSDDVMLYMFGLHPGFNLLGNEPKEKFYVDIGKEMTLKQHPLIPPCVSSETYDRFVEGGKIFITNEIYEHGTIVLDGTPTSADLVGPDGRIVSMSWSENFAHLCIWKAFDDAARYVCIEPWSNLPSDGSKPDDLDEKDMVHLAAGKEDVYTCNFKFC